MDQVKAVEIIWRLVDEGKLAEVAAVLFDHHKNNFKFWCALKHQLLITSEDSHKLLIAATLIDVSTKKTLAQSCRLVPGLSAFLSRKIHGC